MMKFSRSYYCKKIIQAVKTSNKGKKLLGSEVKFVDNLDWDIIDGKGVWTDVFLQLGGSSVFAFTACSSYAAPEHVTGTVPESKRDLDTGLWNLYLHKDYMSPEDVGYLCKKWVELQGPIKGLYLCNVYFNEQRCGYVWGSQQYPRDRTTYSMDDIYGIERYVPINVGRGVCS